MQPPQSESKQYGLFTALAMIIGIVIGSGIFFKSDNILIATGGSVAKGVLLFCFAAVAIVFGSLCMAVFASRTDKPGGITSYAFEFISPAAGSAYGWFELFVYMPTICVIIAWLSAVYTQELFGLPGGLGTQCLIAAGYITVLYAMNLISPKTLGITQNAATVIKLFPLLLIAFFGIRYGTPVSFSTTFSEGLTGSVAWFFAIPAVAFSFDGWIVSTSIAHEIKNEQHNLPLALTIAPIFILLVYILYFIGISHILGPQTIISAGDDHVILAAQKVFGPVGGKILSTFVLISALGGVNGFSIAYPQMPYSMAYFHMLPGSEKLLKFNKNGFPARSLLLAYCITLIWVGIHYVTARYGLLTNSDVSEIAIVSSYLLYVPLYIKVFKLRRELGVFRGVVCPLLATAGSLIIFIGGLQNPLFIAYILFCLLFLCLGYMYYKRAQIRH